MINWKIYTIRDLSGGMKWDISPFLVPKNTFKYIFNFSPDKEGMLIKESGYEAHGTAIAGATGIMGLAPIYYGANQKFVSAVDDDTSVDMYVYDPGDGTWDAQSLTLTTKYKYEFANFLDGLFAVNYADATMFYDGTTWSTSTNVTDAPKSKYVIPYLDRLYLGNVIIGAGTHSSRVVLSELPDDSYNITWDTAKTGLYFDVSPKDGDSIKGLGKNFNRLLIFKEESTWRYDTNTLYQLSGVPGTNNNRTIVNVLDWTIFFHKTGIYGISGNEMQKLSRDIDPFIKGVSSSSLEKLCAYGVGDNYIIYLGNIYNRVEDISIENCMAIYNVAKNKWRLGSITDEPSVFAKYRDDRSDITYNQADIDYDYYDKNYDSLLSADDYHFFGTTAGRIFKLNEDIRTQNTNKIRAYFETYNHYPGGIHAKVKFQGIKFYMKDAKRVKLFYSVDDKSWRPVMRYQQSSGEIYYQFQDDVIGNRIKFKGTDNSAGERLAIHGIDVFFTPQANIV